MIIGITGSFCTGKSTVIDIFRKHKAKIIDLDKLAHKALQHNSVCFKKIISEFGRDIIIDRRIDRLKLAKKVFGNRKNLQKLNAIIHPVVIKEMNGLIEKFSKKFPIITVEVPLLFEAGLENNFDKIIVVKANKQNQINRAKKKRGLSVKDILTRVSSQWPISKKISEADFVIDNNGSISETKKQVEKILKQVK